MQKRKIKVSKKKEISEALIILQHRWPLKSQSKRSQTQEAAHGARLFMWTTYNRKSIYTMISGCQRLRDKRWEIEIDL